jgi:hypothetical protein
LEPDRKPIFAPLVRSFHSAAFYREAAWERSGRYTGYLLFLVVFLWVPRAGALYATLSRYVSTGGEEIARQVPQVRIDKGRATVDRPGPVEIRNPGDNALLMVIDVEGKGRPAAEGEEPVFRLLADRLEVSVPRGVSRSFPLDGVDGFYADGAVFREAAATFPADFTLLFVPFAILLSFAARYAEVRVLALLAGSFARREGACLDREALVRLSVFSVTPAAVTRLGLDMVGLVVPFAFVVDFFASLAYVRFAVRSAAALPPPPAFVE